MPTRTIHCSLCKKSIQGYDFPERMDKLRRHRKKHHPMAHKVSVRRAIRSRNK